VVTGLFRLFSFERRWLVRVLEDVLPPAREAPLDRFVADLFARAPLEFVLGLRACLWLLVVAPPFWLGRVAFYFSLGAGERMTLLSRLRQSRLYVVRELPVLFKMVASLGYGGLSEVQQKIGISPTDREPPDWARP
jgi:hypothetical protein